MDEENEVLTEETEVPLEESQDTTEETEETSQPDSSEAHDDTEPEEAINFERLQRKSQSLESQNAQYQKQLSTYGEWLLKDEARTKDYLESQGLNEAQVAESLNKIRQSRPGIWEKNVEQKIDPSKPQAPQAPVDVQQIKKQVQDEIALDNYVKASQQEFMEAVPEMNPSNYVNATPEERELVADFANKVDYLAKAMMRIQSISYADALKHSYSTLLTQMKGGADDNREAGYIEGLAEKNGDAASSFGEMSGESDPTPTVTLTEQERIYAKKLGMDENEYAKWKRPK